MTLAEPMTLEQARKAFPPIWVIYAQPRDFPTGYVVRVWWGMTPEPAAHAFRTLHQARTHVQDSGACIRCTRAEGDDLAIAEIWL